MPEWWKPSSAKDIQPVPWLAPSVVQYLSEIVKPEFDVLEYGCGGSTLWFTERVKSVTSIDSDSDWKRQVEKLTGKIVFSSLEEVNQDLRFDLILIDGDPVTERAKWLYRAAEIVNPGGWIVLDNANRPEYTDARIWMQRHFECKTFDGNSGGTRYLVTDFYKMKVSNDESRIEPEPKRIRRKSTARSTGGTGTPA